MKMSEDIIAVFYDYISAVPVGQCVLTYYWTSDLVATPLPDTSQD